MIITIFIFYHYNYSLFIIIISHIRIIIVNIIIIIIMMTIIINIINIINNINSIIILIDNNIITAQLLSSSYLPPPTHHHHCGHNHIFWSCKSQILCFDQLSRLRRPPPRAYWHLFLTDHELKPKAASQSEQCFTLAVAAVLSINFIFPEKGGRPLSHSRGNKTTVLLHTTYRAWVCLCCCRDQRFSTI